MIRDGADVVGPEGPIGTVAHVVVDESTREVTELVVRRADGQEWVVPTSEIAGTTDRAVRLQSGWTDLRSTAHEFAPDEFAAISGAESVNPRRVMREASTPARQAGAATHEADALELREEELHVRKETRDLGAVELQKEVIAERQVLDIPVWHEELILERRPVDPPQPTNAAIADQAALRVVLHEEVAMVDKQPVVTESVRAGRRTVRDTQHIDTTIWREVPDVRREGDLRVQQAPHSDSVQENT
ncbi:MAG: YsnF/AvaK domain-containing protein [Chloroflexi bacterium]|nr:YsnF/AvaK domain-containing protein [Chloroflexota bacterium]